MPPLPAQCVPLPLWLRPAPGTACCCTKGPTWFPHQLLQLPPALRRAWCGGAQLLQSVVSLLFSLLGPALQLDCVRGRRLKVCHL